MSHYVWYLAGVWSTVQLVGFLIMMLGTFTYVVHPVPIRAFIAVPHMQAGQVYVVGGAAPCTRAWIESPLFRAI